MRLVARVDDRALQRGLEPDLVLEEVGPLGELVRDAALGAASLSAPTLPAPVKICRVTKNGIRSRTIRANGVARSTR